MTTVANNSIVFDPHSALRFCARASAAIIFVTWLACVITDVLKSNADLGSLAHFLPQAATLAVVFAGYAIGLRHELLGGVLTILGMLTFYVVHVLTLSVPPDLAVAAFALPGLFYVLSWYDHQVDVRSRARDL